MAVATRAGGGGGAAAGEAALVLALAPLGRRPPARSALNVATLHGVGGGARRQIQIGWGRCGDRPTDREREGGRGKKEGEDEEEGKAQFEPEVDDLSLIS